MALSLQKGSSLSLQKTDGSTLTQVRLGLGWDEVPKASKGFLKKITGGGGAIDLDASAILFGKNREVVDIVYYGQLKSRDGSIKHTGDNLTGEGDGDDEQIIVNLTAIPEKVQSVVFTINSYSGQTFNEVKNVFARIVDISSSSEKEILRYNLAESKNTRAVIIAKISRTGNGWEFTAIGEFTDGKTAQQSAPVAVNFA